MKSIMRICIIISLSGMFNHPEGNASELQLCMWDNSAFSVKLDHHHYNVTSHDLVIRNLHAGSHYIVVYQPIYNHYGRRVSERLAYSGYINIPGESMITATISRRNLLNVVSIIPYYRHERVERELYYYDVAMTPVEFRSLKKRLINTRFESEKMEIMEHKIVYNFFTSDQVFEIMILFQFESNRLDIAKLAYHKTIDKHNFHRVYDAFQFSSSIENLERYISHHEYR